MLNDIKVVLFYMFTSYLHRTALHALSVFYTNISFNNQVVLTLFVKMLKGKFYSVFFCLTLLVLDLLDYVL